MNKEQLKQFLKDMPEINSVAYISFFHGVTHWKNVEKFGMMLADEYPEADCDVISWFAYLHDCMRGTEKPFEEHGYLAELFIRRIRKTYLVDLSDEQIKKLKQACKFHTFKIRTKDITVNVCFDADRLDLMRTGTALIPRRMATEAGKRYASRYGYNKLLKLANKKK